MEAPELLPRVEFTHGYDADYPHRGHYARNVLLGCIVFAATCLIIHALLPFPNIPGVAPKLRYFAAHKDEFDTLFVGSSHLYRDVVPEIFDETTAARGTPTHSFNLSLGGMRPPESIYFLEQALSAR